MNNRWTKEEESKLLKYIQNGKTYSEMAGIFNRSENALEMRVKKIIYENIVAKKEPSKIASLLNMHSDKVMQYYYSYRDHLERESKQNVGESRQISDANKLKQLENIQQHVRQDGGNTQSDKIVKLREQNEKLKLLLENYTLKEQVSKIMKNNNDVQKDILKALLQ